MFRTSTIYSLFFLFGCGICYPYKSIPVGLILKEGDVSTSTIIRYALWGRQMRGSASGSDFGIEILKETADLDDAVQVDKAVCRLLKRGVVAIMSPITASSYPVLVTYSNELQMPYLSSKLPEVPPELSARYGIGIQPSTTRAVLDVLRYYKWQGIVYIYDDDYGVEKLQRMFLLGYRVLQLHLDGLLRTSSAEEANLFLRKLDTVKKGLNFRVILDTKPDLAREIIVQHVHDIRVRKNNFHFLLKQLTSEDFWLKTAEFGALNVTGFLAIQPDWPAFKNFNEEWAGLSPNIWEGAGTSITDISTYFFYDAAVILFDALKKHNENYRSSSMLRGIVEPRECHQYPLQPFLEGNSLTRNVKASNLPESLTGRIRFDQSGERKDFSLNIVEPISKGYKKIGTWSDGYGISIGDSFKPSPLPIAIALKDYRIKITTILSPPYMMINEDENGTRYEGNDGYKGYCKDILDMLAEQLGFKYDLQLVKDGFYGKYHEKENRWSGMIGELIDGTAHMAIADLTITAQRQLVVDFTDPIHMISFGVVMKNPSSVLSRSSPYFFLLAFAPGIWICILMSAILACATFYFLTRYTGEPDSLESATGVWGRRFSVVGSIWFFLGSSLFQSTGIYPRSLSSRLLGGTWWFFTLIIACFYIASLTTQLRVDSLNSGNSPQYKQLQALSLEAIIKESVARGWPKIGLLRNSNTAMFIKKSSLPTYVEFTKYVRAHPEVMVDTVEEGMQRVRESNGGYILVIGSSSSGEYHSKQKPCDIVSVYDTSFFSSFGIALKFRSPYGPMVKETLARIQSRGLLGQLHRKWWIETNQCNQPNEDSSSDLTGGSLHAISGMFYLLLAGMLFLVFVSAAQYFWKSQRNEDMRRRLSFEDMNIGNTSLPLPPPEMLEPPVVEQDSRAMDSRIIDRWTERSLVPKTFSADQPTTIETTESNRM